MSTTLTPALAGDSFFSSTTTPAPLNVSAPSPRRRGRPANGSRALTTTERMKLYRLRKTVKRGVKAKRVRWQHLTEAQAYELQLRRQQLRDERHRVFEETTIKEAIKSGEEKLPSNDDWGAAMPDSPSGKGYPLSIEDEESLDALNHKSRANGRKVKPTGRGPVAMAAESAEAEEVFMERHVADESELRCYAEGCSRLVWGVRVVEGEEKFCCDLHQPLVGAE